MKKQFTLLLISLSIIISATSIVFGSYRLGHNMNTNEVNCGVFYCDNYLITDTMGSNVVAGGDEASDTNVQYKYLIMSNGDTIPLVEETDFSQYPDAHPGESCIIMAGDTIPIIDDTTYPDLLARIDSRTEYVITDKNFEPLLDSAFIFFDSINALIAYDRPFTISGWNGDSEITITIPMKDHFTYFGFSDPTDGFFRYRNRIFYIENKDPILNLMLKSTDKVVELNYIKQKEDSIPWDHYINKYVIEVRYGKYYGIPIIPSKRHMDFFNKVRDRKLDSSLEVKK